MLFDTDILIWVLRGYAKASRLIDRTGSRSTSIVSYMELLQGAQDRKEVRDIKRFLRNNGFHVLPLSANIGHRAAIYVEEYGLKVDIGPADALIAATAVENDLPLVTANTRHFSVIEELEVKAFRP